MDGQKLLVAKLTTTNYPTWKFKLKNLLIAKELFEFCDGTAEEPGSSESATAKKAYRQKEKKALSNMYWQ